MRFALRAFLRFIFQSKNQHGVHSPFVFDFVCLCLYHRKNQEFKNELLQIYQKKIKGNSLGLTQERWLLLHRILAYFEIGNFIELSRKGILAKNVYPDLQKSFFSFSSEGILGETTSLGINRGEIIGKENTLFFVGRDFFQQNSEKILLDIIDQAAENSLLILDGIHLTQKNELIWKKLLDHPKIKVSIDLFFWGIIFFKQDQVEEHFKIRFW